MRIKSVFIVILELSVILVTFHKIEVKAEYKTIIVPEDFSKIQEAINFSSEDDMIFVKSGTYHENLVINRSISLVGENVDTTIVDGNPEEGYRIPIKIQADNVSVSGFKVLYGYSGISVGKSNYCNISGNRIAGNEHGVTLINCSYCEVSRNYFELIALSSAIQLSYSNFNTLIGNYITKCTEGIQLRAGSSNNFVTQNTVNNCDDVSIRLLGEYSPPRYYEPNNNIITRNVLSHSSVGVAIYQANNNTLYNNNFINNAHQISANEWYAQQWGYSFSNNTINQNYWSNYNGTDANDDGIGDTAYVIDEHNHDDNPLMVPIQVEIIPELPSWLILPLFLIATSVITAYQKKMKR